MLLSALVLAGIAAATAWAAAIRWWWEPALDREFHRWSQIRRARRLARNLARPLLVVVAGGAPSHLECAVDRLALRLSAGERMQLDACPVVLALPDDSRVVIVCAPLTHGVTFELERVAGRHLFVVNDRGSRDKAL